MTIPLFKISWTVISLLLSWVVVVPFRTSAYAHSAYFVRSSWAVPKIPSPFGANRGKPLRASIVTVDCRLRPEGTFIPEPLFDGIVLHESDPYERLTFVLGEGNYLPGLHDLVATMKVGESVENVSIDAGWGAWNPKLEATLSFESLVGSGIESSQIKVGAQLVLANGVRAGVTKVTADEFTIDANPPLAGASYLADVKLLMVEPGPSENDLEYSPTAFTGSRYQVATFALGTCKITNLKSLSIKMAIYLILWSLWTA